MKKHDGKSHSRARSSREGDIPSRSERDGWDAEGYVLVGANPDNGASGDDDSARYRTVRRAAKEVGIPERTIREWVLMGHLSVAPAITVGYSPFLVNVTELRKVAARFLGSG